MTARAFFAGMAGAALFTVAGLALRVLINARRELAVFDAFAAISQGFHESFRSLTS